MLKPLRFYCIGRDEGGKSSLLIDRFAESRGEINACVQFRFIHPRQYTATDQLGRNR